MNKEFITALKAANNAIHRSRYIRSDQIYEVTPSDIGHLMNLIRVCKALTAEAPSAKERQ